MKVVLVKVLALLLVVITVYFGQMHWNVKMAEARESAKAYNQQIKADEKKRFNAAQKSWLGKLEPRVYVIGSSVAAGAGSSDATKTSWAGLLNSSFLKSNPDLFFSNLGVGGYTTKNILDNNILNYVVDPDVVIFETCLLNNFTKYKVSETQSQIKQIYSEIHKKYPDAKIILMPSEPPPSVDQRVDKEGNTYRQYVGLVGEYIQSQGWEYVDFWNTYESLVENNGHTLKSVLKDEVHPNDIGYKIWFNSIKEYFGILN